MSELTPKPRYQKRHDGLTGRELANPRVITYCDFGEPRRKTELGRHLSFATAMRQYARIWEIYHRGHGWRVWQEEVKEDQEPPPDPQLIPTGGRMAELANRRQKFSAAFHALFKAHLEDYWHNFTGFDILEFDRKVVKPTSMESCADAVKRQWGEEGVLMLKALLEGTH